MKDINMLEEKIPKLLLKFALPTIFSLLISALYNIVDQIFIGHSVGYLGNGATNVVFPMTLISLGIALMIGDGSAAFYSICLGKKSYSEGGKCVGNAITFVIGSALIFVAISLTNLDKILWTFGATENNFPYTVEYFKYILIGIPFFMFASAMNSIIRADGKPQFAMLSMVVGAVINVILDAIMVMGLGWGMMGAGLATSLGQIAAAVISAIYLVRMHHVKLQKRDFIPSRIATKTLPLGISSLLTQLSMMVSMAVLNNALVRYGAFSEFGSDIPLTAMGIVVKVFQIIISIAIGIAVGAQPIAGFNLGANRLDRIGELYKTVIKFEIALGVVATLLLQLFPLQILSVFGTQSPLYEVYGVMAFRIYLSTTLFCLIQKASSIFLQSLGKPVLSMTLSLLRDFVLMIPLVLILSERAGVVGTLYSAPIADIVSFTVTIVVMRFTMKRLHAPQIVAREAVA